ncbi:MAG: GrpB family protein [Kineosporiaceae bacterium]
MGTWPAWATEQVEVQAPRPGWPGLGAQLCMELDTLLAPWLVAAVEHVGSTAIPDLAAKPVLDVQAAVTDLGRAVDIAETLSPRGWHLVPVDLDGRPWRRFLIQVIDGHRVAHLHLLAVGSERWFAQLAFRDALRNSPALVHEYTALKRALAAAHPDDREAYTAGKSSFVQSVLRNSKTTPA